MSMVQYDVSLCKMRQHFCRNILNSLGSKIFGIRFLIPQYSVILSFYCNLKHFNRNPILKRKWTCLWCVPGILRSRDCGWDLSGGSWCPAGTRLSQEAPGSRADRSVASPRDWNLPKDLPRPVMLLCCLLHLFPLLSMQESECWASWMLNACCTTDPHPSQGQCGACLSSFSLASI